MESSQPGHIREAFVLLLNMSDREAKMNLGHSRMRTYVHTYESH
jgi:hypothetical protein